MKIYYCSDLHLDFYISNFSENKSRKLYDKLFKDISGDVIIIAGDISHYNVLTYNFLKLFKEHFDLVLFVGGNHEKYNTSKKQKLKYRSHNAKMNELEEMVSNDKNIEYLNGRTIIYNGIKFGGADGWYDGVYSKYIDPSKNIIDIWKTSMNDSKLIPGISDFYDIFKDEITKIKNVLSEEPDIMISHIAPICSSRIFSERFKNDITSAFYCFDGEYLLNEIHKPKFWIYGHIHDALELDIGGMKLLRNPLGYPKENSNFKMKYFSI